MEIYIDIMLTLCCCLSAVNILMFLWSFIRLDQIRDKIEEVLRWM